MYSLSFSSWKRVAMYPKFQCLIKDTSSLIKTNIFQNIDKYIFQFWKIHFVCFLTRQLPLSVSVQLDLWWGQTAESWRHYTTNQQQICNPQFSYPQQIYNTFKINIYNKQTTDLHPQLSYKRIVFSNHNINKQQLSNRYTTNIQ